MTDEQIEKKFRETYPDFMRGNTPLSPYYDIWCYAIEIMEQENEQVEQLLEKLKCCNNCFHRGFMEYKSKCCFDMTDIKDIENPITHKCKKWVFGE